MYKKILNTRFKWGAMVLFIALLVNSALMGCSSSKKAGDARSASPNLWYNPNRK